MRLAVPLILLAGLCFVPALCADPPTETRYGVALDGKTYPQATAKEALASVLKAIENKRVDYLVAQLADPAYVDDRVQRLYDGKFDSQVEDTRLKVDASIVKLFQRFQKDGEWTSDKMVACLRLKDVKDRCIYFRRIGERWYLEDRNKPE